MPGIFFREPFFEAFEDPPPLMLKSDFLLSRSLMEVFSLSKTIKIRSFANLISVWSSLLVSSSAYLKIEKLKISGSPAAP